MSVTFQHIFHFIISAVKNMLSDLLHEDSSNDFVYPKLVVIGNKQYLYNIPKI